MKKKYLLLPILLAACAQSLTPAGSTVQVSRAPLPTNCTKVGGSIVFDEHGFMVPMDETRLRNMYGKNGATHVTMLPYNNGPLTIADGYVCR